MFDLIPQDAMQQIMNAMGQQTEALGLRCDMQVKIVTAAGQTSEHHITSMLDFNRIMLEALEQGQTLKYSGTMYHGKTIVSSTMDTEINMGAMKAMVEAMMAAMQNIDFESLTAKPSTQ